MTGSTQALVSALVTSVTLGAFIGASKIITPASDAAVAAVFAMFIALGVIYLAPMQFPKIRLIPWGIGMIMGAIGALVFASYIV